MAVVYSRHEKRIQYVKAYTKEVRIHVRNKQIAPYLLGVLLYRRMRAR